MEMSKVLAILLLAVIAMASTSTTDARAVAAEQDEDPPEAPAPAPMSMSPIGAPESNQPSPYPPSGVCFQHCEDAVSDCVVDGCLHIPSGEDQAACINECIQALPICKYNCQLEAEDDHMLNY